MRLAHTRLNVRVSRTPAGFDFCPESDPVHVALRAACRRAGVRYQEAQTVPAPGGLVFDLDTLPGVSPETVAKLKARKEADGVLVMEAAELFALWGVAVPADDAATTHRRSRPMGRGASQVAVMPPVSAPAVFHEPPVEIVPMPEPVDLLPPLAPVLVPEQTGGGSARWLSAGRRGHRAPAHRTPRWCSGCRRLADVCVCEDEDYCDSRESFEYEPAPDLAPTEPEPAAWISLTTSAGGALLDIAQGLGPAAGLAPVPERKPARPRGKLKAPARVV